MTQSMHKKSSIARSFIIYIVVFSSFITLITTSIQLYRDYKSEINHIYTELNEIDSVLLDSITSALWMTNSTLLQTNVEGILQLRDVQYVEIHDDKKVWAKAGALTAENNIQRTYAIIFRHRNKDIHIGDLMVNVGLDDVRQRIYNKILVILIANAIKTFLVAIFIYFLFHRLIARHLFTISRFSEKQDPLSNHQILSLNRELKKYDEFDVVVKSINDMHRRLHQQVTEINHQKKYLSLTLNSIGDAVITTDEKGNVSSLNPMAEKLTGWSKQQALRLPLKTIFPIIDASTREPITNPVERVLETGETVHLSNHTTLLAKDGHEYHIADSAAPIYDEGKILGMVLVFNDVSKQYKMREALKISELEHREILQSMVNGVISIDEDGILLSFNRAAEKLFGYSENEILGENVSQLMPEPFASSHNQYLHNYLKTGIAKVIGKNNEMTGLHKNKKIFPLLLQVSELPVTANGKRRFIGSCSDLTQIKQQQQQLRRAQKIDSLGKLTSGVAHDYNNMLGVILGYANILKDKLKNQGELQKYVENIIHAGERGSKLTQKLLSFSKDKITHAAKLDINRLLKGEQQILEKTLTARIKLELKLQKDLWLVYVDESELEDALLNMTINSMHAIEENGKLSIETHNIELNSHEAMTLGLNKKGEYIKLRITDTGCGMDEKSKDKIFDPFYTSKGDQGTGLGLSQVYEFVKCSGGVIKVSSKLDCGTQFNLYFPRYQNHHRHASKSLNSQSEPNFKGTETILVVDDEPAMLALTVEILKQNDYHVLSADSAKQALVLMQREKIELLVSDIIMPDMGGYELASIVKEKYPEIKIQLVSGFSGNSPLKEGNKVLSKKTLQKPFSAQKLLERIRDLLS